ncbi:MAG: hypothetical protein ACREQV_07575, partial [Candidatus Binatia bacterium]
YLLLVILSLAVSSVTISVVTGAQPREADDDDDDALDDELPSWLELRVFIHQPRVVKPNHLGTCALTVNANVNHFDAAPWHLSGPMTWSLNRRTVPSSVADSVDSVLNASFDTWYSGIFSQGADTRARRARLDMVNAVLWKRLRRSMLGVTYVWYSRVLGDVVEADTVFNKRHPWAIFPNSPECQNSPDAYDLQNIATHEFGHWAGLDDLFDDSDKDLTMYGFGAGGEIKKRTLGTGDVSGKNTLQP